ncbi:MAG: MFS transporter [Candidatus Dormiibacterota bacterium]
MAADLEQERMTPRARRAALAGFIGFLVDYYDIYLPTLALTPALIYFQPKDLPATATTTIGYLVIAVTLIGRPIGAVIFGHFGDVLGRRRATLIAVAGFSVCTILIAALPGYRSWGYGAIVVLIALRLIDGIFMGGEYTSANPLAIEAAPKRLRGLVGGIIATAYPIGYLAISISVTIVLLVLPAAGLDSPFVQWGWRLPFIFGGLIGAAFFVYFFYFVQDSEAWEKTAKADRPTAPLKELLGGRNLRSLAQVFLMMSGFWLGVQACVSVVPGLLETYFKRPAGEVTNGLIVANVVLIFAYLGCALLGQRLGRRPMLVASGVWTIVLSTSAYLLMVLTVQNRAPFVLTILFDTIALGLTLGPWGIVTTYINERFPTNVRASGYGIGYSLAVILPSFYGFYMLLLSRLIPYQYTPVVLVALGGVLVLVGALLGPETRDVRLDSVHGVETVGAAELAGP